MISKEIYTLPDADLAYSDKSEGIMVWIPEYTCIVLGRSNQEERSVNIKQAHTDGIKIIQRPSGGETVILSPKTLVISVKLINEKELKTHDYFSTINRRIIAGLQSCGVNNLNERGISDITLGHLKILGSAMHRKPESIFYHAVLNVSESPEIIEKYLSHPTREPNYRKGRSHKEFITSLQNESYNIDLKTIKQAVEKELKTLLKNK